jgi:hypothetical protein
LYDSLRRHFVVVFSWGGQALVQVPVFRIRIGFFHADPYPAFYLIADTDPGQTLMSKTVGF